MKKNIYTQEEIDNMIDLYINQGLTLNAVGEQYGVSRSVISRVFKENNVETRKTNHKYKADYRKFENIDSAEKAYWLGFIAADGCVYTREENASIIINVNNKDKEHLEKFKNFMNSNVEIKDFIQDKGFSNNTKMSKIVFNSKDMANDFIKHGVVPRKSLILEPPKISEEYYLPFILGYFDGDGSIFKSSQYNNYGISIVGTKELLEWINNLLNISTKLEKRDNQSERNNYYIRCGGTNKPYKIMKQLYNSCPQHMERKYNIFKNLETVVLDGNVK